MSKSVISPKPKHFKLRTHIALAVKQGKFQVQRVTFASNGVSTIEPLSAWVNYDHAKELIAEAAKAEEQKQNQLN